MVKNFAKDKEKIRINGFCACGVSMASPVGGFYGLTPV